MYDSEEVREKRKRLYVIIGIVVFLILLIILFLLIKMSSKGSSKKDNALSCTIAVMNNVKPDADGVYKEEIEIGFTEINYDQKKSTLIKQTIGTADASRNTDTFKVTKSGQYNLHGYLQDSNGNEATCDLSLVVELNYPTCELEVSEGVAGTNGWYKSDVVVSFKDANTNNSNSTIIKYFIEKSNDAIDYNSHPNSDKYIVIDNKETKLTGYILDSNGNEGTCSIAVKRDNTKPTCSLKVTQGTTDASGVYTDNPVIGFVDAKDDITGIKEKGIGISKNYSNATFTVSTEGTTVVHGYVKDEAGNEGECTINITKASQVQQPDPNPNPPSPNPPSVPDPSCSITQTYGNIDKLDQSTNPYNVIISSNSSGQKKLVFTLNVNNATKYGMGETETYNGQREYVITKAGVYRFRGYAMNSAGRKCITDEVYIVVRDGELLYNKVQLGDYVAYDAGGSRNNGQKCSSSDDIRNGWRVLNIDKANQRVILVSAGSPECIQHGTSSSTTISTMNSRASNYLNRTYAVSAVPLTCNESVYGVYNCKGSLINRDIHMTGGTYFLATKASDSAMYAIDKNGSPQELTNTKAGMRVVITLDSKVVTTGKNSNGQWVIVRY